MYIGTLISYLKSLPQNILNLTLEYLYLTSICVETVLESFGSIACKKR